MTLLKMADGLRVGRDFVDAIVGDIVAHGEIGVKIGSREPRFKWESTIPIVEAEHALRGAAAEDGYRVVYFQSQAK